MKELTTVGYQQLDASGAPWGSVILVNKSPGVSDALQAEVVRRDQAEALIARMRDDYHSANAAVKAITAQSAELAYQNMTLSEELRLEKNNLWIYREVVKDVASALGGVSTKDEEPNSLSMAIEVRNKVLSFYRPRNRLLRALHVLFKGH